MKITGIIAEYNPFHNGHRHQLQTARSRTRADYVLVVMNGDFMQRGTPAFWNKYLRAEMAIANGADVVIELPALYGTASAEYFALGGIQLLQQLNCVNHVCFGCETENLLLLQSIADLLIQEPDSFRFLLNQQLAAGHSYPKARAAAVLQTISPAVASDSRLEALLTMPNTILAIEYLKALTRLHSPIQPVPCLRSDSGYHSEALEQNCSSATAIRREYIRQGCTPALRQVLPDSVLSALEAAYQNGSPIDMEDFYPYLQYILWKSPEGLTDYLDVSEALANRIRSVYRPEYDYQQFLEAIVTKQYTNTRIQRALLHILLDIRQDTMNRHTKAGTMHYARLLAFRAEASPCLKELKKHSEIPLITKLTAGLELLAEQGDTEGLRMLQQDIACAHLYEQVRSRRYGVPAVNEYTKGVIIGDTGHF